jgi:hypothetical protein
MLPIAIFGIQNDPIGANHDDSPSKFSKWIQQDDFFVVVALILQSQINRRGCCLKGNVFGLRVFWYIDGDFQFKGFFGPTIFRGNALATK